MLSTRKLYAEWRRLNDLLFSGELKRPTITYGPTDAYVLEELDEPSVLGYCESLTKVRVHIHIDSQCVSDAVGYAILAHEMVHQYQHQMGLEMEHDASFDAWRIPILWLTGHDIWRSNDISV